MGILVLRKEGVAIPEIIRFGMYCENYGEEKRAMLEYAALEDRKKVNLLKRVLESHLLSREGFPVGKFGLSFGWSMMPSMKKPARS